MPSVSKSQYRFFKFLQENPEEAKKRGIKAQTVKDYADNMSKERFKKLKERVKK